VLLVGAGEMAELTARHLRQAGARHLRVCNRTLAHAELLAEEARKAEALVTQEVERFLRERTERDGLPVLARLRQHAEEIARAEVERTLSSLGEELSERQRKRIEAMARAIVNKLLHGPTARLRMAGPMPDDNRLAGAAAELFGLGF